MRGNRSYEPSGSLALIDHVTVTPLDPIAYRAAVARSEGQGRRSIFRRTDTSCDDARPENISRRRSLALDRSEHDGRLTGNRDGGLFAAVPVVMAMVIGTVIVTASPFGASAGEHDIGTPIDRAAIASSTHDPSVDRSPVDADDADPWSAHIAEAARRFAIPERWIHAVMTVESAGDVRALSSAGAMGLMQIMPATWEQLRLKHGLGNDPYDVHDSILAGAAYLRAMYDRYGSIAAMLAAYNAGPGRYEKHLAGTPLPAETVEYVAKIMPMIDRQTAFPRFVRRRAGGSEIASGPLCAMTANGASASHSSLFVSSSGIETEDHQTLDDHPTGRPSGVGVITDLLALVPPSDGLFIPRSRHGVAE